MTTNATDQHTRSLFAVTPHTHAGHFDVCPHCRRSLYRGRCRRRTCPAYAAHYLRDLARCIRDNLGEWDGRVAMLTLTAPGANVLPWDESVCADRPKHRHSGPDGCRVHAFDVVDLGGRRVVRGGAQWNLAVERNLSRLTKAAHRAVRRSGCPGRVTVLLRVDERQSRGVFHPHIALGIRTAADRVALDVFCGYVKANRAQYGFSARENGYDLTPPDKYVPGHAAVYMAKYVRPDRAKASFVPLLRDIERVARVNERTGRREIVRPVYVSRCLTSRSRVTMRHLRVRRYVFRLFPTATPSDVRYAAELLLLFEGSRLDHLEVMPRPPTRAAVRAVQQDQILDQISRRPAALAAPLPGLRWVDFNDDEKRTECGY